MKETIINFNFLRANMQNSKHFVLVHGICHGAWCWYKILALLKAAGHRVTALDLGGCGVNSNSNSKQLNHQISSISISDYLQPLMDFLASLPEEEKVILVGHSYGGMAISLAMESFPNKILVAVFVTAFMPNCAFPPATLVLEFFKRTPMESLLDFQFFFDDGPEKLPTSALFGPNYMAANLYQHCQPEDMELAKMLIKPSRLLLKELSKESLLTEDKFGSVNRVFIVCESDGLLKKDLQEWFLEIMPTKDVKFIAGADHMVMLSKPIELCHMFLDIADRY
ncbi:hypothetical protein P3X46_018842 [Hevea brasiliensis]|uniref:AB hydrolase-1 domain-containing protein n=1 Tax=Hevea brasiliensis TaxID=3981 RepID=A0ABQ9LRY4_HEVBR|nr:methyl jasmonate esterase 1 [Hevea brasiliensis]KAJ9170762.1 hypothetical protein P3X46_018842 [Hevea brasiliensis]